MLKLLIKILKSLNGNSHPGEIAHAVSLALLMGLMPKTNALFYLVTVFCLFIRINKAAFILLTLLFSMLTSVTDPILDSVGWWVLNLECLKPVFAALLEIPFVGFTMFNYTIVMGALVCGILLYIPAYGLGRLFVWLFRAKIIPVVRKAKIIMILSKIPLVQKIANYQD